MIISDFKIDKEVIRAKQVHVRDLCKVFTKNPKQFISPLPFPASC